MELLIMFGIMALFFVWMGRSAKKAQQNQLDQRAQAIVIGNNVVTTAGFFGRIVDIDGDAVTLESPSGDETVWLRTSILQEMDVPLGSDDSAFTDESAAFDAEPAAGDSVQSDALDAEPTCEDLSTPNPFDDDNKGSAWK